MDLTDLHCHLLWGLDDGPKGPEASLALARTYLQKGITRVSATPHVNHRHRNRAAEIESRRGELVAMLEASNIALRVEPGAEIAADVLSEIDDEELRRLRLGEGSWLLVEPPTRASAFDIHHEVFSVQERGFQVLLAHPERNPALQRDVRLLSDLVAAGVRTQITAESLTGRYGSAAERSARELLDLKLVHVVASDAHHATQRPPGLSSELKRSGYAHLTEWLCRDMPTWILDGGDEPSRPEAVERVGFFSRLLGRSGATGG